MTYVANVAAFFTNWCWVFIWGRRFLAIYRPLRRFRQKRSSRKETMYALVMLALIALIVEVWSILYTTEYSVDGMVQCELDEEVTR